MKERDSRYASLAVETSSRVIRESRVACLKQRWAAAAARKLKGSIMTTITTRISIKIDLDVKIDDDKVDNNNFDTVINSILDDIKKRS